MVARPGCQICHFSGYEIDARAIAFPEKGFIKLDMRPWAHMLCHELRDSCGGRTGKLQGRSQGYRAASESTGVLHCLKALIAIGDCTKAFRVAVVSSRTNPDKAAGERAGKRAKDCRPVAPGFPGLVHHLAGVRPSPRTTSPARKRPVLDRPLLPPPWPPRPRALPCKTWPY